MLYGANVAVKPGQDQHAVIIQHAPFPILIIHNVYRRHHHQLHQLPVVLNRQVVQVLVQAPRHRLLVAVLVPAHHQARPLQTIVSKG